MAKKRQKISTTEQATLLVGLILATFISIIGSIFVTTMFRFEDNPTIERGFDLLVSLAGLVFLVCWFLIMLNHRIERI